MIYALQNKNTGEPRYVGRTQKPLGERLANHLYTAREHRGNTPKDRWIREVGEQNIGIMKLGEGSDEAELWWMDYLEFLGGDLLNVIREPIGGKAGNSGLEVTDEVKELMGTMPDRELGEKLGFARNTIAKHRNRHGIEAFGNNGGYDLPEELVEQLGEVPDRELAREYDMTISTVQAHRRKREINPAGVWEHNLPDRFYELLGEKTDGQIAEQFDVSRATVRRRREERNIDGWNSHTVTRSEAEEIKWLYVESDILGTEISEIYDVPYGNVISMKNRDHVDCVKPEWFGNK